MTSSSWSFVRVDLWIFLGMFIFASSRDRLVRLNSSLILFVFGLIPWGPFSVSLAVNIGVDQSVQSKF